MSKKYLIKSFIWGIIAKVFDAIVKFISVPLLLVYFGKDEFGLIALASSVNAYLQLLDLGINTGSIKYFSQWIAEEKMSLLDSTARTGITFYATVGIVNAFILIGVALGGMELFAVSYQQAEVLKELFLILALFAVFNWSTSVFGQLLTANHNIQYVQKIGIFKTLANLLVIYITIWLKLNISIYFLLFCIANSFIVIPYYLKSKKSGLISSYVPKTDWANFRIIFRYSLAIIAMSLFQLSATKLRPIILGVLSLNATEVLAEYRIMETITVFITSIGGMFVTILLPMTSRLIMEGNREVLGQFVYKTTLFTSIVCTLLCLPFVLAGTEVLQLYVGKEYVQLYPWLLIWIMTILFYLHSSPVASLILSTGKTRILVISSAISCIISVIVNAILCKKLGVGSAIVGYLIYIIMQMSFYYFYFNSRVLYLDSWKVFKSFLKPVTLGILTMIMVHQFDIKTSSLLVQGILKCSIWIVLFSGLLFIFKVVRFNDIREMTNLAKNKN